MVGAFGAYGAANAPRAQADSGQPASIRPVYNAIKIRENAGFPSSEPDGPRYGHNPGIESDATLADRGSLSIESEADAKSLAVAGDGSRKNPYLIKNIRNVDSNESFAFLWDDPSADDDYHIQLENALFRNHSGGEIRHNGSGCLKLRQCVLSSLGTALIHENGSCTASNTEFAGSANNSIRIDGGEDIQIRDCLFSARLGPRSTRAIDIISLSSIDIRYSRIEGPRIAGIELRSQDDVQVIVKNVGIYGIGWGIRDEPNNAGSFGKGSTFRHLYIADTGRNAIRVTGANAGNYEIAYSTFEDAGQGGKARTVVLNVDNYDNRPIGWNVHHCKLARSDGTDEPSNEMLESFYGSDIHFHHNWVDGAPEDCYEHAFPVKNVSVTHSVGDNVSGELVDIFKSGNPDAEQTTHRSINGQFHHIYGDSGRELIRIGGVDDCFVHSIYGKVTSNKTHAIRLAGVTGSTIIGPLPTHDNTGKGTLRIDKPYLNTILYRRDGEWVTGGDVPTSWVDLDS